MKWSESAAWQATDREQVEDLPSINKSGEKITFYHI